MRLKSAIFSVLFISISLISFADGLTTKTIKLDRFTGFNLMGHYQVYLKQGSKQVVKVEASKEFIEKLNRTVKNGIWSIKTKKWKWNKKQGTVKIYITLPKITYLSLAGSGKIHGETKLNVQDLKIKIAGSGNINVAVNGKKLKSNIAGSGNIYLKGKANTISHALAGSGSLKASGLKVRTAKIRITGSGSSKMQVSQSLNASITGSGNVYYKGNPSITKSIRGSGKVRKQA